MGDSQDYFHHNSDSLFPTFEDTDMEFESEDADMEFEFTNDAHLSSMEPTQLVESGVPMLQGSFSKFIRIR